MIGFSHNARKPPPTFKHPKRDWLLARAWISAHEAYHLRNRLPLKERTSFSGAFLEGPPAEWFYRLPVKFQAVDQDTWAEFKKLFLEDMSEHD